MLIKQLSIFLENKKGRFTEVAKILGRQGSIVRFHGSQRIPISVSFA